MSVETVNSSSSLVEVIDRILDKGITVNTQIQMGIEFPVIGAFWKVTSVETYLCYAAAAGLIPTLELVMNH